MSDEYGVFLGLVVGKTGHHAVALDSAGKVGCARASRSKLTEIAEPRAHRMDACLVEQIFAALGIETLVVPGTMSAEHPAEAGGPASSVSIHPRAVATVPVSSCLANDSRGQIDGAAPQNAGRGRGPPSE
ncbi:hypothetical protein [Paractinoplanes lichenicola]|uniref:Uncharacterized protein n=1 Tax=Paractinoplanes lichenicola TaxID=2802976 RepID=A0ABS1VQ38_9ACTN|nr:hypothetical protein [Actinoplanes lichenicola]MBL7255646.1 hypothetical protein [Actinoplanes lichenicola]